MFLNPINPGLLFGFAFIAIPIVLHLILRQKPKQLEFPPLRFLKRRQQSNSVRLRIWHWILLAARILAVALIVFALARPRTNAAPGLLSNQKAPVAAAFVVDTSPRMLYQFNNETRLIAAERLALWLIGQLPQESQVAVIDSSIASAVFQVDVGAAQDQLERLEVSMSPEELSTCIESGIQLLKTADEKLRKEMYVFTDFSEAAWSSSAVNMLETKLKETPGLSIYLIDVGSEDIQNNSLKSLRFSSEVASKNTAIRLQTNILREGPAEKRSVDLYLNDSSGKPLKKDSQSLDLQTDSIQSLEFVLGRLDEGIHQGYLEISGLDGLTLDNIQYFTVEVKPAWKILLVAGTSREALFLQQALSPEELKRQGAARYDVDRIRFPALKEHALRETYSTVCLLDPPKLDSSVWSHLREYVQFGGSLLIALGPQADPDSFNQEAAQLLLGGTLLQKGRGPVYLAPNNYSHPLLSEFRPYESKSPWPYFPVYTYWTLDVPTDVQTIIAYSNQLEALVERRVGKGKVLTLSTPISQSAGDRFTWNELTANDNWGFVMLMDQTMMYLAGSLKGQLNYQTGDAAHVQLPTELPATTFLMSMPGNRELRLTSQFNEATLMVPSSDLEKPGNYLLRGQVDSKTIERGFSVNLAPNACQLQRADIEPIKAALKDYPVQFAKNKEEINLVVGKGRVGQELFSVLVFLLALVLGVEYVLANRFYQTQSIGT